MLHAEIFPFRQDLMLTAVKAIFQMTQGTNQFVSVHQVSREIYTSIYRKIIFFLILFFFFTCTIV